MMKRLAQPLPCLLCLLPLLTGLPALAQTSTTWEVQRRAQADDYNTAQKLYQDGQYEKARTLYKKAFERDGYYASAYAGMIDCTLKLGDRAQALTMYDYFFRPPTPASETKPTFNYGNTAFAARRGADYVQLLLNAGQTERARQVLADLKTAWLKNSRDSLTDNRIPFDDTLPGAGASGKELRFQALLLSGTMGVLTHDGFIHYGEPPAATVLEEARRLRPDSALAGYLLALSYSRDPKRFPAFSRHLRESARQGRTSEALRPYLALWQDPQYVGWSLLERVPQNQIKALQKSLRAEASAAR